MPFRLRGYTGKELTELMDKLNNIQHTSTNSNTYVLTEKEYDKFLKLKASAAVIEPATKLSLGGIIVGDGLNITESGILSNGIKNATYLNMNDNTTVEEKLASINARIMSLKLKLDRNVLKLMDGDNELSRVTLNLPEGSSGINYKVVNDLKNCTTNNSSTTVTEGDIYKSIITARKGYKISNIVVTMNGLDITNSITYKASVEVEGDVLKLSALSIEDKTLYLAVKDDVLYIADNKSFSINIPVVNGDITIYVNCIPE